MPASTSGRRRKLARRKRNRERERERRTRNYKSVPARKIISLRFRGGLELRYDLTDAIRLPWDGEHEVDREDVFRKLWDDADHDVIEGGH